MHVIAVPHRLLEFQMLTHHRSEKTTEPRNGPQFFQSCFEVGTQQCPDDWCGRPLFKFLSQFSDWVFQKCALLHLPIQEPVDNTGAMRNQVGSPTPASILQPFLYRFLRDHAVFAARANETFEAVQSAEVNRVSLNA